MTVEESLKTWDEGGTVWTIEMGGLGPGYEMALQVLVMELIRHGNLPKKDDKKVWETWGDEAVERCTPFTGGFSGAQVVAAKNLAVKVLQHGWDWVFDQVKDEPDRKMMISRHFPQAPPPPKKKDAA